MDIITLTLIGSGMVAGTALAYFSHRATCEEIGDDMIMLYKETPKNQKDRRDRIARLYRFFTNRKMPI